MDKWCVGDFTIERVIEFEAPVLDPYVLFPDATKEAIDTHRHWLEPGLLDPETGMLILAFHSFVIRTPRHIILVDTCGGNDKNRPDRARYHMNRWPYLDNLSASGVRPEDVDFVLCTHLHVDHVGWNTRLLDGRWTPTFPNARYLFGRREWEFWQAEFKDSGSIESHHYEDSILPVVEAGQAVFVENDHAIEDGLWLSPTPGHTPGQVCLHLSSGGREAVMTGDLMHHAVQCAEPDWSTCFCSDPALSRRTRRSFLDRYAETDTLVLPAHFPTPSGGRIVRGGDAWRFVFEGGGGGGR
jgi:glyoxylase-like metal-dependent hydrolase (beta-lactamase superfamily II)